MQVENRSLGEVVQLQTHYIQELKKYHESGIQESWSKIQEIWVSHGNSCQHMAQSLDKQGSVLNQLGGESRLLVQSVQQMAHQQLPDVVNQVDLGLQNLGQRAHECFLKLDNRVNQVVVDVQEIHGVFGQVSLRLKNWLQDHLPWRV